MIEKTRKKIIRMLSGGWNYPTAEEVNRNNIQMIKALDRKLHRLVYKHRVLEAEYNTLIEMYEELADKHEKERLGTLAESEFAKVFIDDLAFIFEEEEV